MLLTVMAVPLALWMLLTAFGSSDDRCKAGSESEEKHPNQQAEVHPGDSRPLQRTQGNRGLLATAERRAPAGDAYFPAGFNK